MKKERGRSGKSWLLALGAVALAAAVGFGVPLALRNFEDAKRLSQVTAEAAAEVRITPQTELGIAEKAELFRSADANSTVLEKGKNYDAAGSLVKAEEELQTLSEMGVLDESFHSAGITGNEAEQSTTPIFYIDSSGEKSMIVWMLGFQMTTENDSWLLEAVLDDETGKLLGLDVQRWDESYYNGIYDVKAGAGVSVDSAESSEESEPVETTETLAIRDRAEKFGDYLGLTVERVTQNWEMTESALDEEDRITYENQVRVYEKKGYTEEEAGKRVSEEWGLTDVNPDGSETAQVIYREGDTAQVSYYIRLGANSLAIYFDL